MSPEIVAKPLHFFEPRAVYRLRAAEAPFADYDDFVQGTNPPYGASMHFWLKAEAKDSVTVTMANAAGKVVRTQKVAGKAGMNRVWWDLLTDKTREPLLRTTNPYSPDVRYPAEGKASPTFGRFDALVPPGTYSVTVAAAGQRQSQQLVVRRDPASGAADSEITVQTAMLAELASEVNATVDMINSIESVRAQLATIKATLNADSAMADLRAQSDSLEKRLLAVEGQLMDLHATGRGQDLIRTPSQSGEQLLYLGGSVGGSDYAPTDAHRQVQAVLKEALQKVRGQYDSVMGAELAAFKALLRSRSVQAPIIF